MCRGEGRQGRARGREDGAKIDAILVMGRCSVVHSLSYECSWVVLLLCLKQRFCLYFVGYTLVCACVCVCACSIPYSSRGNMLALRVVMLLHDAQRRWKSRGLEKRWRVKSPNRHTGQQYRATKTHAHLCTQQDMIK